MRPVKPILAQVAEIKIDQEVWVPANFNYKSQKKREVKPLCVIIWELPSEDNQWHYEIMTHSNIGHQHFIGCKRESFYLTKEECQQAINNGVQPWANEAFERKIITK